MIEPLKRCLIGMIVAASASYVAAAAAQTPPAQTPPAPPAAADAVQSPNDYGDAKSWLCRPGRHEIGRASCRERVFGYV